MTKLIRAFIPVLLSMIISMSVTALSQQLIPDIAGNASALAAVTAFITIGCLAALRKQDQRFGTGHTAGRLTLYFSSSKTEGDTFQRGYSILKRIWLPVFCVLAFMAGAAASVLGGRIMEAAGAYRFFSNDVQEQLYSAQLWVQLLGPGLLVPIAEELTYRVVFYERLRTFMPRAVSMAVVSLLFAAGHGNWIQALYAFPMSMLLCICYELCGSPVGPTAMHMGANLISIFITAMQ